MSNREIHAGGQRKNGEALVNKIYIDVAFADKDAARAAGARWDKDAKKWYAHDPVTAAAAQTAANEHCARREALEREEALDRAKQQQLQRTAALEAQRQRNAADVELARGVEVKAGALGALAQAGSFYATRLRKSFLHADEEHALRSIYWEHQELFDAFDLPSGTRNRTDSRMLSSARSNLARAQRALAALNK